MKRILFGFLCISLLLSSCEKSDSNAYDDISAEIVGEWVYDDPSNNAWQSMKFIDEGRFFCYSDNMEDWTETLKTIKRGSYSINGNMISASNGNTYLDMSVSSINGYEFSTKFNETNLVFKFHKVVMRSHLNYGESILPPYTELVDSKILGYKSHDENIASVDSEGKIIANVNNGRTYVDIITQSGTALIKVMIGKVDDGDRNEVSPIPNGQGNVNLNDPELVVSKAIQGKWVWDKSYWETINFLPNGKLYYSNSDAERGIYNDNASGDYTVDDINRKISLKVVPNGGTQMILDLEIVSINKYSFTAKYYLSDGSSTGTYTYAKQLESIELLQGEKTTPEYNRMVEAKTNIIKFESHNSDIVEVNSETGELTSKKGGRTYIDVVTDEGTAVVEVLVKGFMAYNYADFIGKSKREVTNVFEFLYTTDGDDIIYNYSDGSVASVSGLVKDGNWDYISFRIDPKTGLVIAVTLLAKKDVWFTPENMVQYLSQLFYVYENGTEDTYKAFMNAETIEEATIGVTWDMTKGILTFVQIPKKEETSVLDYGGYLDKTREEIKSAMNGYSILSDNEESIGYTIGSDYLRMIKFSFESKKEIKNTVQSVVLYLQSGHDENFVKSEIEKNYTFGDGVEGNYYNYYSSDYKIQVSYIPSSNLLQFILR